jgi:hypothetical protein
MDIALSEATGPKQLNNFKRYYKQIAALTPDARRNLIGNLNRLVDRLPHNVQEIVMKMSKRTEQYVDPSALGEPISGTASTINAIVGLTATLATLGLTVYGAVDQRQKDKDAANAAKRAEAANQQLLNAQIEQQNLTNEALRQQLAAKVPTSGQAAIAADGSLVVPAKTNTAAVVTGLALTGAAAYMLSN